MKWKDVASEDLKQYKYRRESLTNIAERIALLKSSFQAIKVGTSDKTPVQGGENHYEDRLLDNIVERQRLEQNYKMTSRLIRLTERGLSSVDDRDRLLLDMFFITRPHDYIDKCIYEIGCERTRVYELKDEALYKFTVFMYGLTEL